MLATEAARPVETVSAASVKGHIWAAFRPVNAFLQFYFTPFANPQKTVLYAMESRRPLRKRVMVDETSPPPGRPQPHTGEGNRAVDSAQGPAISIVLPVHNGERYLQAALDSIAGQTFRDFEVIAVDDCSTDSTPAILATGAARHDWLSVITNRTNLKLPATLNVGFAAARGEWLSWTSDDNLLRPDTLARLIDSARSNPVDIVYAGFAIIDEEANRTGTGEVGPASDLVFGNCVGCCFLYRREVDAALGGYDEHLFGVEDYDFWLRAADAGFRFRLLADELYDYRRHGGSLTDTRSRQIHALVAPLMLRRIDALPASPRRAEALVRLACRDPYTLRWRLIGRAWHDHPLTVMRHAGSILRWVKYAARVRLD
ncbi:MAG: glycosyl transferase [Citromicrobium sp.]|nr:MAG: glycosyl transferase [Citromicrobium sp.]